MHRSATLLLAACLLVPAVAVGDAGTDDARKESKQDPVEESGRGDARSRSSVEKLQGMIALLDEDDKPYVRVLAVLATVPDDHLRENRVVREAAKLLDLLRPTGEDGRRFRAELARHPEARRKIGILLATLTSLHYVPKDTEAIQAGRDPELRRQAVARVRLESAQRYEEAGKRVDAYEAYRDLAEKYVGTDAGTQAAEKSAAMEKDEDLMAQVRQAEREARARSLLERAQAHQEAGEKEDAIRLYTALTEEFPGTAWARKARKALAGLRMR
jgi:hypothetical protein